MISKCLAVTSNALTLFIYITKESQVSSSLSIICILERKKELKFTKKSDLNAKREQKLPRLRTLTSHNISLETPIKCITNPADIYLLKVNNRTLGRCH